MFVCAVLYRQDFCGNGELMTSVILRIVAAQVAEEQSVRLPPLDDDFSLNETAFDSLALAILVARPENDPDIDPFILSEHAALALTVGDTMRALENVHA